LNLKTLYTGILDAVFSLAVFWVGVPKKYSKVWQLTKSREFKPSSWRGSLDTTLPYVIKFVSDLRQVCGFIRVLRFPPQKNWLPRYNWNIVESGVTHHKLNSVTLASQMSNFWVLFWYSYSKNSQWEHCIQYTGIKCFQVHTTKNYMYVYCRFWVDINQYGTTWT
jgi:hypothetical protein